MNYCAMKVEQFLFAPIPVIKLHILRSPKFYYRGLNLKTFKPLVRKVEIILLVSNGASGNFYGIAQLVLAQSRNSRK